MIFEPSSTATCVLSAHGLAEALFEEINRQLDARGLMSARAR